MLWIDAIETCIWKEQKSSKWKMVNFYDETKENIKGHKFLIIHTKY